MKYSNRASSLRRGFETEKFSNVKVLSLLGSQLCVVAHFSLSIRRLTAYNRGKLGDV